MFYYANQLSISWMIIELAISIKKAPINGITINANCEAPYFFVTPSCLQWL